MANKRRSVWVVEMRARWGEWKVFHPCYQRKQAFSVLKYREEYEEGNRKWRVVRYDASK